MMNPELLVQDLPSTSIITIRSIRGSNGSIDFIDHQGIIDHGNGNHFKIGIGWVFLAFSNTWL